MTPSEDVRDFWLSRSGLAVVLATILSGTTIYLGVALPGLSWVQVGVLSAATIAATWLLLGFGDGYERASDADLVEIRSGSLWHVTGADVIGDDGLAHLDPARCRWISRVGEWRRPWRRHRAVYAFRNPPRKSQLAIYVRKSQRASVLRLDGSQVTRAYVGRAGAVALPDGYLGPAVLEPSL